MTDYIRLSDVPFRAYKRINETMSDSYCWRCNKRREVKLPDQPSGEGECLTCGGRLDMWDTSERGERTRFMSNYRPDPLGTIIAMANQGLLWAEREAEECESAGLEADAARTMAEVCRNIVEQAELLEKNE